MRVPPHSRRAVLRWASLPVLLAALAALLPLSGRPQQGKPEQGGKPAQKEQSPRFIDLSLLVAPDYPCTWPTFPVFQINHYQRIGRLGAYNSDVLVIDGNTGTQ